MGHQYHSEHGNNEHRSSGYNGYYGHQGHTEHRNWLTVLERVRGNKKLKFLILTAAIVLLSVIILLIVLLFPLIVKMFNYILQNGLQGLWDSITGFVDKLWKGSK
jgi:hypothetical protein